VDKRSQDIDALLDLLAECFDNGMAVYYGTPLLDATTNHPTTAGELLERIRLGKGDDRG